jgi:hypothetical protein
VTAVIAENNKDVKPDDLKLHVQAHRLVTKPASHCTKYHSYVSLYPGTVDVHLINEDSSIEPLLV